MNPVAIARRMACLFFPDARLLAGVKAIRAAARPLARRGVTLIELMVALAITMIMMTAVITLFANVTTTVSSSRALIEISERLRTARNRLQLDLAGHTATTIPPLRPEDGEGYLEIIEGPNTDSGSYFPPASPTLIQLGGVPNPINGTTIAYAGSFATGSANDLMGDADDVLMLTVRSQGEPFVGWAAGGVLTESGTAEVIWYAVPNGRSLPGDNTGALNGAPVQLYTLYRRVLLVAPLFVPSGTAFTANTPSSISQFYNQFDLSVRSDSTTGNAVGNSLTDLTARENRFLHAVQVATTPTTYLPTISSLSGWPLNAATAWLAPGTSPTLITSYPFPYALQNPGYMIAPASGSNNYLTSSLVTMPAALFNNPSPLHPNNQRQGEDVILTDVLSFDIRVFDPLAPLVAGASNTALVPGDPGYSYPPAPGATVLSPTLPFPTGTTVVGYGAFVDIGYGGPLFTSSQAATMPKSEPSQLSYFSALPGPVANTAKSALLGYTPTTPSSSLLASLMQTLPCTYDTWSLSYENNGLAGSLTVGDEDQVYNADQGTNGRDDDGNGIVDDPPQMSLAPGAVGFTSASNPTGERETVTQYPVPLRGVQITIRVYEPDTRQVREMTIVQDFLPD